MDHLDFVISRVWRNDNKQIEIASAGTILNEDDKIFVITTDQDADSVKTFIGEEIDMERKQWIRMESQFINRRIFDYKAGFEWQETGTIEITQVIRYQYHPYQPCGRGFGSYAGSDVAGGRPCECGRYRDGRV